MYEHLDDKYILNAQNLTFEFENPRSEKLKYINFGTTSRESPRFRTKL